MTYHLRRVREHMAHETEALLLLAKRARLFDSTTNRGSEAEHSVRQWLNARFSPDHAVSSGEIIDSFDTNVDLKSRQQDGILHVNGADANRFILPSGMRLFPVETVAAVVEVKLTLDKGEFDKAEKAATETARLRLRASRGSDFPDFKRDGTPAPTVTEEQRQTGVSAADPLFDRPPVTFALFAFEGIADLGTIRGWIKDTTISVVCCLSAGCTARGGYVPVPSGLYVTAPDANSEAGADDSLWHFAETLDLVTKHHAHIMRSFRPDFNGYASYARTLVLPPVQVDWSSFVPNATDKEGGSP